MEAGKFLLNIPNHTLPWTILASLFMEVGHSFFLPVMLTSFYMLVISTLLLFVPVLT